MEIKTYWEDLSDYKKLIDKCWSQPPQEMFEYAFAPSEKYPIKFRFLRENENLISAVMIYFLGEKIYGISAMATDPEYQGKGYGTKLMQKVHEEFKGLFLLKVRKEKSGFYSKLGYKIVSSDDKNHFMCFLNNSEVIDF